MGEGLQGGNQPHNCMLLCEPQTRQQSHVFKPSWKARRVGVCLTPRVYSKGRGQQVRRLSSCSKRFLTYMMGKWERKVLDSSLESTSMNRQNGRNCANEALQGTTSAIHPKATPAPYTSSSSSNYLPHTRTVTYQLCSREVVLGGLWVFSDQRFPSFWGWKGNTYCTWGLCGCALSCIYIERH